MKEVQNKGIYCETKNGITVKIDRYSSELLSSNFFEEYPTWFRYALHHKSYNLGKYEDSLDHYDYNSWEEYKEALIDIYTPVFIFPVYMLDHSNISFSIIPFNDKWDSGQIGWAYLTKDDILNIAEITDEPVTKESAKDLLTKELNAYEAYCNGMIYSIEVIDKNNDTNLSMLVFGNNFSTNGVLDVIPEKFNHKEFLKNVDKL